MRCIAVEPGNQWFVTGSADRTIKVRDWMKLLANEALEVLYLFFFLIFKNFYNPWKKSHSWYRQNAVYRAAKYFSFTSESQMEENLWSITNT